MISVLLDIFYVPNFGYFEGKGVFKQPRLLTSVVYWLSGRKASQAASLAIAAPVGCKATTASSNERERGHDPERHA